MLGYSKGPRPDGQVDTAVQIVQQVRAQASQLAAHLRKQQAALDHREAELNARVGAMETQFRNARLWLSEHQQELTEQKTALEPRQKEVEARVAEVSKLDGASQTLAKPRSKSCGGAKQRWKRAKQCWHRAWLRSPSPPMPPRNHGLRPTIATTNKC